jgi:hypothetical protein
VRTIVPLFAGIYKRGAGLGPAIAFLFLAPAANILALAYTGGVIGVDLAVARLVLSLTFGIGIGLIMALLFHRDELAREHDAQEVVPAETPQPIHRPALLFLLVMVALLLAGTLKLGFLTRAYASFTLPVAGIDAYQGWLHRLVPFERSAEAQLHRSCVRATSADRTRFGAAVEQQRWRCHFLLAWAKATASDWAATRLRPPDGASSESLQQRS